MKVPAKNQLLNAINAYPVIILGCTPLSGLALSGYAVLGNDLPTPLLRFFAFTGFLLLGLIAFVVFILLIAAVANAISQLARRRRSSS
ncbi:MAG: hypothetical protein AAF750_13875 [Planctomycetota bacterium]